MKPLNQVSYSDTSATIFQYASAGVSLDISMDDVTRDCVIVYKRPYGQRWMTRSFEQASSFAKKVMERFPVKPFVCECDY